MKKHITSSDIRNGIEKGRHLRSQAAGELGRSLSQATGRLFERASRGFRSSHR